MKDRIKQLNTEIQKLTADAKSLYEEMDRKSDKGVREYDGHSDDLTKFNKLIADGERKKDERDRLQTLSALDADVNQPAPDAKAVPSPAGGAVVIKSLGQQLIESDQFKQARERGIREIKGFELERKDLNELTEGAGGGLVWSDRQTMVKEKPQRPLSILDVIPTLPTSSNAVDYVVEATYTEAAAFAAEKAAKPESTLTFARKTANVGTVAHYIVVTEQIMEDVPYLRALINTRLGDGVMRKLEDYVINGDGTGGNPIVGLLSTVGIGARVHQTASGGMGTATDNPFDTIRYAVADLTLKFYRPDVISYNATLSAKFDTAKDLEGRYIMSYDPVVKRMWNLRVVEAAGVIVPAGTALVLDSMRSCTLFDRGTRRVDIGWINDQFVKNQFCVRGEGRFAFAVEYPEGVEKVTGL